MKNMGEAKKILRMESHRDRALRRLCLSKSGYARKVLERFNMENAKLVSTPSYCLLHCAQRQIMICRICQRSHMQVQ